MPGAECFSDEETEPVAHAADELQQGEQQKSERPQADAAAASNAAPARAITATPKTTHVGRRRQMVLSVNKQRKRFAPVDWHAERASEARKVFEEHCNSPRLLARIEAYANLKEAEAAAIERQGAVPHNRHPKAPMQLG